MAMRHAIAVKRIYAPPAADDGTRILVDGLWPRGLSRAEAAIDAWLKEVAPSAALRQWFAHDPAKWSGFQRRYFAELDGNAEALSDLRARLATGGTLLYAARDELHNNAVALRDYLAR